MRSMFLLTLILFLPGCTVTGRAYYEHERGPDRLGTCVEWRD